MIQIKWVGISFIHKTWNWIVFITLLSIWIWSLNASNIVDCEWSEWQEGHCSTSCGRGTRLSRRVKIKEASRGGRQCFGPSTKTEICNNMMCPGNFLLNRLIVQFKYASYSQINFSKSLNCCYIKLPYMICIEDKVQW